MEGWGQGAERARPAGRIGDGEDGREEPGRTLRLGLMQHPASLLRNGREDAGGSHGSGRCRWAKGGGVRESVWAGGLGDG